MMNKIDLKAYAVQNPPPRIRAGTTPRDWMEKAPERFPYRCLPMTVANQGCWEVLCPSTMVATWNGKNGTQDIHVKYPESPSNFALSHFGEGVLTFNLGYLFRTSPGWNLLVKGPPNAPRDGLVALEGIVETDWSHATFTMNWKFTRPTSVVFEAGDPFCCIMPIPRYNTEDVEPEILDLAHDNPELHKAYTEWSKSRNEFNRDLKVADSQAVKDRWQKDYFHGELPDGTKYEGHQTKISPPPFVDKRPEGLKGRFQYQGAQKRLVTVIGNDGKPIMLQVAATDRPDVPKDVKSSQGV